MNLLFTKWLCPTYAGKKYATFALNFLNLPGAPVSFIEISGCGGDEDGSNDMHPFPPPSLSSSTFSSNYYGFLCESSGTAEGRWGTGRPPHGPPAPERRGVERERDDGETNEAQCSLAPPVDPLLRPPSVLPPSLSRPTSLSPPPAPSDRRTASECE